MFFWRIYKVFKNKINPLQVRKRTFWNGLKRTSRSASDFHNNKQQMAEDNERTSFLAEICSEKGSGTVEAMVIIPLLLCAFLGIMMWQQVFLVHQDVESALLETARQVARREAFWEEGEEGSGLVQAGLLFFSNYKQDDSLYGVDIKNVSLLGSEYRKTTKEVYLRAGYEIQIPLFLLGTWRIPLTTAVVQKAWNGYAPRAGETAYGEEYVYVTKYGEVYHKSSQCYHLLVHVEETRDVDLYYDGKSSLRACQYCVDGRSEKAVLYIPEEGECYHENADCGGITRTVSYKKKSETGARRPCTDCVLE